MVDLERLKALGRRAYELDRLLFASRVTVIIAAIFAVCAIAAPQLPVAPAAALLTLSIWLRWRSRRGAEAVATGLWAGLGPLFIGLLLTRGALGCDPAVCMAAAAGGGVVAGVAVALDARRCSVRTSGVLSSFAVAGLVACLGCLSLGVFELVALLVGNLPGLVVGLLVAHGHAHRSA